MLHANEQRVLDAAIELVGRIGISPNHTVAAAAMEDGEHQTPGPGRNRTHSSSSKMTTGMKPRYWPHRRGHVPLILASIVTACPS